MGSIHVGEKLKTQKSQFNPLPANLNFNAFTISDKIIDSNLTSPHNFVSYVFEWCKEFRSFGMFKAKIAMPQNGLRKGADPKQR